VGALARRPPATTAFVERWKAAQRAAGRSDRVQRAWVPYAAISPSLKTAVLVAEDINFFSHGGFDGGEIRKALSQALEEGELPRGASTITQQLAKNLWLSPSRDPLRKTREAILTWQLERTLSKRRILELYLNVVEFGPGVFGAEAAARRYYGRPAADLDDDEAAQLAAALPSPARWHPAARSAAARRHAEIVRRRMDRARFLRRLL
jgi:monofunctional biosynthetic peptidoglycan transglycosylase